VAAEIGIVLVEDDAIVQDWVRAALGATEFEVVGTSGTAADAPALIEGRAPKILLVDYRLPDSTGIDLIRDLRRRGVGTAAILMSASPMAGLNESAREAGAQGTLVKTGRVTELLEALRLVGSGRPFFDARHPRRSGGRAKLSPRERQVLMLVAQGSTNREAAAELGIGEQTVKTLLARTYAKLGVSRRSEAVAIAYQFGLL
jgi:DNA-binding NarL/FixJ family response regulator